MDGLLLAQTFFGIIQKGKLDLKYRLNSDNSQQSFKKCPFLNTDRLVWAENLGGTEACFSSLAASSSARHTPRLLVQHSSDAWRFAMLKLFKNSTRKFWLRPSKRGLSVSLGGLLVSRSGGGFGSVSLSAEISTKNMESKSVLTH